MMMSKHTGLYTYTKVLHIHYKYTVYFVYTNAIYIWLVIIYNTYTNYIPIHPIPTQHQTHNYNTYVVFCLNIWNFCNLILKSVIHLFLLNNNISSSFIYISESRSSALSIACTSNISPFIVSTLAAIEALWEARMSTSFVTSSRVGAEVEEDDCSLDDSKGELSLLSSLLDWYVGGLVLG